MPDSAARTEPAPKSFSAPAYRLGDFAPVISLALIVLVFSLIVERFLSLGTLSLILQQSAVLAIVATGLTFVLLCAEIDLSVGMVALLSACLCGVLWEQSFAAGSKGAHAKEVNLLTTALIVTAPIIIAVFAGWLSGRLTVSSGLPSFIITLAMMNIALGLARFLTRSEKFAVPPALASLGNDAWRLFGDLRLPRSAVLAAVVMLIAHLVLQHTRFGRYVYMTGGNRDAARLAGVRTDKIVVACLALCGLTAAIGGLVNAGRLNSVSLDQNADLLLDAVACVVLGGTSLFGGEGSIGRTVIGVLTFTTLKVGLNLTNVERLIKSLPLSPAWKENLLDASWVTQFDLLRPFLLGVVLLMALVIHGRLVKRRE
ncbi:MAG TPA: ABC transporter permease [Planctomycetaceae bacterium]|nr:ABC transporter permease [Planctomycetaceae bacterium]